MKGGVSLMGKPEPYHYGKCPACYIGDMIWNPDLSVMGGWICSNPRCKHKEFYHGYGR